MGIEDKPRLSLSTHDFLQTKISIPRLQSGLVLRSRLIDRLDDFSRYRFALVSASAGFGKTTLIAGWVRRLQSACPNAGFAWLSLDERDNDPGRFWSYLIYSIQRSRPEIGSSGIGLLGSTPPSPIHLVVDGLLNDLSFETSPDMPLFLILDDLHFVNEPTVLEEMTYFMDNLPPDVYVVIATRTEPHLPLARWRVRRQLLELKHGELRFSSHETEDFLTAMDLKLNRDDQAVLERRTEGWIAGLQLAALSLREREDPAAFLAAFNGSHRHVLDYLSEEVLARLPESTLDFVSRTSILQRLSAPLCDAVAGRDDSRSVLEWLEQHNLFLSPLDEEREWFRYHNLFHDMLRSRLNRTAKSGEIATLHQKASAWYADHGFISDAIDHALAGEVPEKAADLLEANIETLLLRPEFSRILKQLETLPQPLIERRARLCLAYAVALTSHAEFLECETWLEKAESAIGVKANSPDTSLGSPEIVQFMGWVDAFRATLAVNLGNLSDVFPLAERALSRLPRQDRMIRCIVALNLGDAYANQGEHDRAEAAFEEAIEGGKASGNLIIAVVAMGSMGSLKFRLGKLHEAHQIFKDALELSRLSGGIMLPAAGKIEVFLAELLLEWNDLHGALRQAENAILHCRQWGHQEHLVDGLMFLAQIHMTSGQEQEAWETLREAERVARAGLEKRRSVQGNFSQGQMRHRLALIGEVAAWFSMATQHIHDAEAWAESIGLTPESRPFVRETGAYVRLLVEQNRKQEALALLEPFLLWVEEMSYPTFVLRVKNQLASALFSVGQTDEALKRVAETLQMGEAEGFIRSFLNEGPSMEKMLHLAVARNICPDYARRLLAEFKGKDEAEAKSYGALVEPLTDRELEVLRLLSAGKSNPEIAGALFLAVGTVKKHINNIFGKLDVASRTQALLKAKELGLI